MDNRAAVRLKLGAAAHNPFNLPRCKHVAPQRDFEFYKGEQIQMCGAYAEVDVFAEAHDLPFEADSLDYVISSHVVEHLPDIPRAFKEWDRVVRDGGYVFMIVPHPTALPEDVGLPLSTVEEIVKASEEWGLVKIMDTDGDSKRKKTRMCLQNLPLPCFLFAPSEFQPNSVHYLL